MKEYLATESCRMDYGTFAQDLEARMAQRLGKKDVYDLCMIYVWICNCIGYTKKTYFHSRWTSQARYILPTDHFLAISKKGLLSPFSIRRQSRVQAGTEP
jgi:hypothetical protein